MVILTAFRPYPHLRITSFAISNARTVADPAPET